MKTKILPAHHSGRLRPHHHTSYGSLLLIAALATIPVFFTQRYVSADTSGSGVTGTYAVVPAPLISSPAIISRPANGQTLTTSDPVTVEGTCPQQSLVKIFKNEVMAGAALCQKGTFSIPVSLFVGGNSLVARSYNANDLPGPDSSPVTVQLNPPGVSLPQGVFDPNQPPAGQLYVTTEVYYRGGSPGDNMGWPLTIAGGQGPYAISVNWGDGKSDLYSRQTAGQFNISHIYKKVAGYGGTYAVNVKVTDVAGNKAGLQVFALVPGPYQATTVTSTTKSTTSLTTIVQTSWRVLALVFFGILSFWLGERQHLFNLHHIIK